MKIVFENAPIIGFECESCLIADLYSKRLASFIYFKANKHKRMKFSFSQAEGFAINKVLGRFDEFYNSFIRMDLENQLRPAAFQAKFKPVKLLEHE